MRFSPTFLFIIASLHAIGQTVEIDSLIRVAEQETLHDTIRAYVYNDISYLHSNIDPKEVRRYARTALSFSDEARPDKFRARSYLLMGRGYFYENIYDSALIFVKKSLEIGHYLGHTISIIDANIELSNIWKKTGQYERAFEAAFKSLQAADSLNDQYRVAVFSLDIGLMFYDQYETREAIASFNRAYDAFESLGIRGGMLAAKGNLGLAYKQIDAEKALETYNEMYQEFGALFMESDSARFFVNRGNILLDLERYDEAETNILRSLAIRKQLNFPSGVAYCYKELAELYLRTGRYQQALENAQLALAIAEETQEVALLEMTTRQQAEAYYALGNAPEAYQLLQRNQVHKDSIFSKEKIAISNELETKYETEKKEQQIALQHEKLLTQEARLAQAATQRNALVGGTFLLLIIGGLVINRQKLSLRSKAREKELAELKLAKTRDELELREQELLTYALTIAQKNNLLHNVKEEARKTEDLTEANNRLKKINHEIANGHNLNQQWDEFRQRFEKIHQRFFDQLSELANDLTNTDRRICAYLKLGLTSKQIANLQHVSVESVEVRRSSIRKKLGLTKEENLSTYITNIS